MADPDPDSTAAMPAELNLDVQWIDGTDPDEPSYQTHQLEAHTFVIRQSLRLSPEGPFIFLLFGASRALLLDTGAAKGPAASQLRSVVDTLIDDWLTAHPRENYELLVAHSHGHGDHTAGDDEFIERPRTTVVPGELDSVVEYFGFAQWPAGTATLDLGSRELLVIPSPGHQAAAVTFYDPWTGLLLTGDTVYPGRLYAPDMGAFASTIDKLVDLAAHHPVSHLLGCHIELPRKPGADYPLGARRHPDERPLTMSVPQLQALRKLAAECVDNPGVHATDDFIVYSGMRRRDQLKLLFRSIGSPLRK
ncbi:MBL fold metallo-hydrolase [Arthrobacter castelli]|uniref:MBL fold metallo-hydrolase n=1 Tax=Arthrobacter castelli TaxID=271431 RepID=UPI00041F40E9|nr:MBL fold metallo-hydrolase [Arthrobacter castelli]